MSSATMNTSEFEFQNSYASLPPVFYESVNPTFVKTPTLFAFNNELAKDLGLDSGHLNTPKGAEIFAGNSIPEGAAPLAMAYAGHQFGNWVPRLGDGRAVLLGEVMDSNGSLQDIQLKGSGRTPFSRGGDGRAWVGPVMREYLVSEAMHRLGVPTTRALAAVTTGESIIRESGPLPGAVLTRVAPSHLRVGTFEYFAGIGDHESLATLVNYAIERHYPHPARTAVGDQVPALYLLHKVIDAQAKLIAHWQSLGFIHGVMNTDNASIAGITIDYGPCAFMDQYAANKVFSSIDQQGRYAYQNQPRIGHWNVASLAQTLVPLIDSDEDKAVASAQAAVNEFPSCYVHHYLNRFRRKLGIQPIELTQSDRTLQESDLALVNALLEHMESSHQDFTLAFRQLTRRRESSALTDSPTDCTSGIELPEAWVRSWSDRLQKDRATQTTDSPEVSLELMRQANPVVIPRNHRVEEAIAAAVNGDFEPFYALDRVLRSPYRDQPEYRQYEEPPTEENAVTATFCGT